MFYCQSVDPLSISDEKIDEAGTGDESRSDDEDNRFDPVDSDSDTDQTKFDSSHKTRSEEIVVVSIEFCFYVDQNILSMKICRLNFCCSLCKLPLILFQIPEVYINDGNEGNVCDVDDVFSNVNLILKAI